MTAAESGESATIELTSDITCTETITIADGQSLRLTSGEGDAKYSVNAGNPFTGGTSVSTSAEEDGAGGGSNSLFVVEKGGALDASSVKFDTSGSAAGDGGETTTTSATGAGGSGGGIRTIYNAGNVTVADCEFVGTGANADAGAGQVANGGAVRRSI